MKPAREIPDTDAHLALRLLEGRWKLAILVQLCNSGSMRFSELARSIPGISKRMLTQQLKQLQADNLIARHCAEGSTIRIEYSPTEWGRALKPSLNQLLRWAQKQPANGEQLSEDIASRP